MRKIECECVTCKKKKKKKKWCDLMIDLKKKNLNLYINVRDLDDLSTRFLRHTTFSTTIKLVKIDSTFFLLLLKFIRKDEFLGILV